MARNPSYTQQTEILIEEIADAGFEIYKYNIEGEDIATVEECQAHHPTADHQDWHVQQARSCDMMGVCIEKTFNGMRISGYFLLVFGNGYGELVADYSYKYTGDNIIQKYGQERNDAHVKYNEETRAIVDRANERVEEIREAIEKVEELGGTVEF